MKHLLSINKNLVFMQGAVCAIHPQFFGFSFIAHEGIQLEGPEDAAMVCNCTPLIKLCDSKEVDVMDFRPEEHRIVITSPYNFEPVIEEIDDKSTIEECYKRMNAASLLSDIKAGNKWTDSEGSQHAVGSFSVDNGLMTDILNQIGEGDAIELSIGKDIRLQNHSTKPPTKISLQGVTIPTPVSVILNEDSKPIFQSSFLEQEVTDELPSADAAASTVYVADKAFMAVVNKANTLIVTDTYKR